jgi:hypothetical protein
MDTTLSTQNENSKVQNLQGPQSPESTTTTQASMKGEEDSSPSKDDCPVCNTVANALKKWPGSMDLELGSWQGFLDRIQCACCQMIVQLMKEGERPHYHKHEPTCSLSIHKSGSLFIIASVSYIIMLSISFFYTYRTNACPRIREMLTSRSR